MSQKNKSKDRLRQKRREARQRQANQPAVNAPTIPQTPPAASVPLPVRVPMFSPPTRKVAEFSEIEIRDSLYANDGNVSAVAIAFSVDRAELFEFIRERPHLFSVITSAQEGLHDMAQAILRKALKKGRAWASEFTIKYLGQDREYELSTPLAAGKGPDKRPHSKSTIAEQVRIQELETPKHPGLDANEPLFVQNLDRAGGNVLQALVQYMGDFRTAAKALGVNRRQLIDYIMLRPDLQKALGDKREELIDLAEATLRELVRQEVPWAIRFVLTSLGRLRGYSREPRGKRNRTQPHARFDKSQLTREELAEYERLHKLVFGRGKSEQREQSPMSPPRQQGSSSAANLVSPPREQGSSSPQSPMSPPRQQGSSSAASPPNPVSPPRQQASSCLLTPLRQQMATRSNNVNNAAHAIPSSDSPNAARIDQDLGHLPEDIPKSDSPPGGRPPPGESS